MSAGSWAGPFSVPKGTKELGQYDAVEVVAGDGTPYAYVLVDDCRDKSGAKARATLIAEVLNTSGPPYPYQKEPTP